MDKAVVGVHGKKLLECHKNIECTPPNRPEASCFPCEIYAIVIGSVNTTLIFNDLCPLKL